MRDGPAGLATQRQRVHEQFLQGEFKRGNVSVGVYQLVERIEETLGGRRSELAHGRRGEVERWNRFVDEVSDGKVDLANGE